MSKISTISNLKLYLINKVLTKSNYKRKTIISLLLIVLLLAILIFNSSKKYSTHRYNAGEYIGVAAGYHSDISVKVMTDDYRILTINVIDHHEMPVISEVVFKDIPYRVIRENSTDVDIVSGATYTSKGLLKALDNALENAHFIILEAD